MRTVSLFSVGLLLWAATLHAQAKRHPAAEPVWGPAPAVFAAGARMAVITGDPTRAMPFTIELSMPDGYRIPPHFHPTDETVTVKKGSFLVGMGDTLDVAKTKAMKPADSGTLHAGAHHFAVASGATLVTVSAMGPFAMTYVNPADNPQSASQR